jgi:hypothetical protein
MEKVTLEELYASGELELKNLKKVKAKFTLTCNYCQSSDIAIMVEGDDDGYCETCSSPYGRATIKCKDCGQGISIRS